VFERAIALVAIESNLTLVWCHLSDLKPDRHQLH